MNRRFLVSLFCVFPVGFSWLQLSLKDWQLNYAGAKLEWMVENQEKYPTMWNQDRDIERLREVIEEVSK